MEVKVKIEGKFYWKTEWQQFVFDGTVIIPTDDKGNIPSVLLKKDFCFFGENLTQNWGWLKEEGKYRHIFISANSLCELEEELKNRAQKEIENLRKVKRENMEKLNLNKEIVMEFIV